MTARAELTVIEGGGAERLALSLVHSRERIDVPVSALVGIEAYADQTFQIIETGELRTVEAPRVEVYLAPSVRARLRALTAMILKEPLEIVVAGRCVSRPVVREVLGEDPCFMISARGFAEAEALAQTMRAGWRRPTLRVVTEAET